MSPVPRWVRTDGTKSKRWEMMQKTFESYGLTEVGLSQTSRNVAGAGFDICAAISVHVQNGAFCHDPHGPVSCQQTGISEIWCHLTWDLRVWPKCYQFSGILTKQSFNSHMKSQNIHLRRFYTSLFYTSWLLRHANVRRQKKKKGVCNQAAGDCNQTKATANNRCLLNCLVLVGNAWNVRWMLSVMCLYGYWFNQAKHPKAQTLRQSL